MAIARPTDPYPDPSWSGWGDPGLVQALAPDLLQLLKAGLGVDGAGAPAPPISSIALPEPRLDGDALVAGVSARTRDGRSVARLRGGDRQV
jgi:hypothetical protein